ncbi:MAG TPA: multidrug efflux RND transporter permease subunit, partial [Gemmataceae bacterium]|nr:multidrug efflux RND transporter permease subunit [Gemmataceae bacterium]
MISRFFIDRPIFATVLSIIITLAGAIAVFALPIAQYPPIAPPTVQVSCTYPGASAQVVADTVAAPIEQQVNGVEGMIYMSSQCGNDGSYNLTVTFDLDTDLNIALVMVQNRVSLAMPQLPSSVQKQGLTIKKKTPNILLVIDFFSPDGRYDAIYLSNYATIYAKDEIFRLQGVGDITYLGQRDYSIRAWLDPQKLASRNITANDVANAIQNQNVAAAPGQVGQQPAPPGEAFQLPTDTLGRLSDPEQFGDIIIKAIPGGSNSETARIVRLKDVAEVEMGAANYNQIATVDGMPAAALAIYQLPGTNALDVADRVRAKMEDLKKRFPDGLDYGIYYDTTPFIRESVEDVVKTLLEAIALVAIVVLVFLQNWRAAIIPLIAVPVAIIGTFAVMKAIGFSLNNISLFGLVLAIGIVVDDAIVVVENVERWLQQGLPAREAARKAMDEVTGPVVAVAVVLCAVFVPCAFITGITGQFFRQFAVTIAVSTVFSALNSLTLSPALASLLLKPHGSSHRKDPLEFLLNLTMGWFFRIFNWAFKIGTDAYAWVVGITLRICALALLVYVGLLGVTGWMFSWYPVGFIPQQDQGWLLVNVQLPDSASVQRTAEVMLRLDKIARKTPGVVHTTGVAGQSILLTSNSSNFGSMFVVLDAFDNRKKPELHANEIMLRLREEFGKEIREAAVNVFSAPPVPGIGVASGFKLMVEDRGAQGMQNLQTQTDRLIDKIRKERGFIMVSTQFRADTPMLYMDIDRSKVRSLGISIDDVNQALQVYLGSLYVNNFNAFGRYWQVNIQAAGNFRNEVQDIAQIKLRNSKGEMVPLSTLVRMSNVGGPVMVTRYNLYASAPVNGIIIPPLSSGEGIKVVDDLVDTVLPRSMGAEWTDLTYMQIKAGNTAMYVFGLAVVFVFLALAALYESWSLPLAVILVVPMCLLCSLVGVMLRRLAMDIFVQIGFVVLVGLACKNAILIVEFARQLRDGGKNRFDATKEACRLRLRPILMTSFAFILGVLPMVIAQGAGAEMRWSLGTAVFSGMLGVTLFGIFLTPVFFYVIDGLGGTSLFRLPQVQWGGSALLGAGVGLAIGFMAYKAGIPHLRWALVGGVGLGI